MKYLLPLCAFLLALPAGNYACAQQPDATAEQPASTPDWHPSLATALAAAEKSGKKIIVDIYAPWCPWCRRMQNEVYAAGDVQNYLRERFEVVRLNGEITDDKIEYMGYTLSSAELAQGLGATGYPTTVFLGPDGKYITRLPGFAELKDFLPVLRYIGSDAFTSQTYDDFLEASRRPSGGR